MEYRITDDIHELKRVLPLQLTQKLDELGNTDELIEIVLDLGRLPTARYLNTEVSLSEQEVTREDIDIIVDNIGNFDADNRAGMERTLHRISGMRNRRGDVVGLTCRVGRAVYGTIDIIQDLVESGQSVLLLGPPGVGKTTLLREAARVLAEARRVVIVDTSNEIGGDGDVPHPAVGKARRMQVSRPERQHEVMIEAVENHNPEVIVIDEIGRELEAMAARTIAERGVQLIGTAHGNALDNLLLNPTLSDLVGGIGAVTLSDDEARRRGTQKTVLERKAPPTFDVLVEIQTRDRVHVQEDVAAAVDAILRGKPNPIEIRSRNAEGEIEVDTLIPETRTVNDRQGERQGREGATREGGRRHGRSGRTRSYDPSYEMQYERNGGYDRDARDAFDAFENGNEIPAPLAVDGLKTIHLYAYGVARNRLQQAARRLRVPLVVVDDFAQADVIVTLKNYYRRRPRLIVDAERRGMPVYVLRANTVSQMETFLIDIFQTGGGAGNDKPEDPFGHAMREIKAAIVQVRNGAAYVDLTPQAAHIRARQHQIARRAHLSTLSYGEEPQRRVRVTRAS